MIKVLIVDDSPLVRRRYERALSSQRDMEVVGTAPDPFVARDLVVQRKPDVVTLDLEMPRMDGISFLKKLMHYHPLPVVVVSALTCRGGEKALEAMRAGAVSVICKPGPDHDEGQMFAELVSAVREAARARLPRAHAAMRPAPRPAESKAPGVASRCAIAIGASTGGTVAIETLLESMPADGPALLIVQHMPQLFTGPFAERLDRLSPMRVREARDGDSLVCGQALVAPGGKHMLVRRTGLGLRVLVKDGPPVSGHRPSVDVLFRSVATALGRNAVGVLLTGMGADGARGLLEMREAGAFTVAQDEASSVVFGMPKAAAELGAAMRVLDLDAIAGAALAACERR